MSNHYVLLIEDNPDNKLVINQFLLEIGYKESEILICEELSQVTQLHEDNLKVILTKPAFTDTPPQQTLITIQHKFPFSPVIVLTEVKDPETERLLLLQGAAGYLVNGKFDSKELQNTIWNTLIRNNGANPYKKLFDENPIPMYIYDQHTYRFLAINEAALKQYGYTRKELLSMNAWQIRPEEDVKRFISANQNIGETYHDFGQWRHLRKNGELFYVHIYAHTTEFKGKSATLVFAVDIDKRVKGELALYEKAEEINVILNSITDSFFAVNRDWKFTFVNKAFEQLMHSSKKQLLGKTLWKVFPQSKTLKFFSEYNRAIKDQVSVHFKEYDPIHEIWVSVNAYPTKDGLAVYVVNITEEKTAQERIFNNEQNLRAIINNTKDIIWSIDRDNNIISANQAFWDRVKMIAGRDTKVNREDFEPDLYGEWKQYFKKAFEGKSYRITLKNQVNEKEVFEEVSFNPIFDKNSQVIGISCFSRDVTEQHNHVSKIEQQNEQLRQIAWIQSHEVRNPVASILGLVKLFNRDEPHDAENLEILDKVEEAAMDLDRVIRKITEHTKETEI